MEPIRTTPLPLAIAHAPVETPDPGVINDGTRSTPTPAPLPKAAPAPKPDNQAKVEVPAPPPEAPPAVSSRPPAAPSYPKAPRRPKKDPPPLAPPPPLYPERSRSDTEAASQQLDQMISQGILKASYVGTGQHEKMISFSLQNTSNKEVTVQLSPGMILNPGPNHRVQPLLVDDHADVTLAPGESRSGDLYSYCMDSRVPAPPAGQAIDYRFASRTKDGGPEAVRVLEAAKAMFAPGPYRRAVTQLAIWRSLGQRVGPDQVMSVLEEKAFDPKLRKAVLHDVERVLEQAARK